MQNSERLCSNVPKARYDVVLTGMVLLVLHCMSHVGGCGPDETPQGEQTKNDGKNIAADATVRVPVRRYQLDLDDNNLRYPAPLQLVACKRTLVGQFWLDEPKGGSVVFASDLITGQTKASVSLPWRGRIAWGGCDALAIVPGWGHAGKGRWLSIPTLEDMPLAQELPAGWPLPTSSDRILAVEEDEDKGGILHIYDRSGRQLRRLSPKAFDLMDPQYHVTEDRLVVTGRKEVSPDDAASEDEVTKERIAVELWDWRQGKKLGCYEGAAEAGGAAKPQRLGDNFAVKVDRASWEVRSLARGELQFSISRPATKEDWWGLGMELLNVSGGYSYVKESGVFIVEENTLKTDQTRLSVYDSQSGAKLHSVDFSRRKYDRCWPVAVGDRWCVLVRTWDAFHVLPLDAPENQWIVQELPKGQRTETVASGRFISISPKREIDIYDLEAMAAKSSANTPAPAAGDN